MAVTRRSDCEVLVLIESELGEGPRWDQSSQTLIFVDVLAGLLHRIRPGAHAPNTRELGQALGAANPTTAGGLVLAMRDGIYLADADGSNLRLFAPVEVEDTSHRMNDAACDPQGRLWAGTMSFEAVPGAGTLYRIDPDGTVNAVLHDLTISNGIGWSPAGDRLYFIDSPTRRIDVLDFDGERGAASNRRPFVDVMDTPGVPDGLTVDVEGGLWVAFWGGAQVRRYASDGRLTDIVEVPAPQPTSCTFGGPDGQDLFITSARLGMSQEDLEAYPLSGSVFTCRTTTQGLPVHPFTAP
jgi:sugar lactone lactonase YvrE